MRIAFQGVIGAYSHQAVVEKYPGAEPVPSRSFEAVLANVHEGRADLAMLPVENSTFGRVADVHYLLPNSGLHIIGESFVRVRINWLARPDQDPAKITRAISHPVLLGQCRRFLQAQGLEWDNWVDTASAAAHVANSDDPTISALSSPLAGQHYGLHALAEGVEDNHDNTTRFLVLSREAAKIAPGPDVMTSFIFNVRNIPAALYKAMGGFATNKVNMTKLESYMVNGQFSATQFYADIEGHPEDVGVRHAFEELDFFTHDIKVLGVYHQDRAGRNIG